MYTKPSWGSPSSGVNPLFRCLRGPQTLVVVAPHESPSSSRLARSRVEDSSRGLRLTLRKNRSVPTSLKLGTIPSASSTSRLSPPHPESLGRSPPTRPLGGQTSPLPSKKKPPQRLSLLLLPTSYLLIFFLAGEFPRPPFSKPKSPNRDFTSLSFPYFARRLSVPFGHFLTAVAFPIMRPIIRTRKPGRRPSGDAYFTRSPLHNAALCKPSSDQRCSCGRQRARSWDPQDKFSSCQRQRFGVAPISPPNHL